MLPLLVAILVAAGSLLRGSWDLWAQSLLFLLLTAGSTAWLCARFFSGYVPLPSSRTLVWVAALIALGSFSAHFSPVASYAVAAWRGTLAALWVFLAITTISKDQRSAIDEAIRAAAWVLVLLAFYQHYQQGIARPAASLPNENLFAGVILMLLPLALQKRDWALMAGLALCLVWTRSVGAWLGLSAALVLRRRDCGAAGYWLGLIAGFFCAVAVYSKFQTPEVLHRWQWWSGAAKMAWDRPWLGAGPGAFAYLWPSYQRGGDFSSLYAHQHLLETAAEFGLPYCLIWLVGIVHCLRSGGPHKSFGALAVFIQSFWDYSLSMPAILWLFSYCAGSTVSESSRGINIPSRYKLPACIFVMGLGFAAGSTVWNQWRADRLRAQALELLSSPSGTREARVRLEESLRLAPGPETALLMSEVELRGDAAESSPRGRLLAAAAQLERAVELNPYRARIWLGLERMYTELGQPDLARRKREQGALFCPVLRS